MSSRSADAAAKSAASLEAATRMNNTEVREKEKVQASLVDYYKDEDKVTVIGAPMYQAWFGSKMPLILNGIPIYVPLDGNRYEIPESYAQIFNERIRSVNEEIELQKRRSNVTANHESFPGELDLIRPL